MSWRVSKLLSTTTYFLAKHIYNRLHVNITIVPALVDIYNYSIDRRAVFSSWKKARLTPIFKKDDETDSGNYRPVSLLSVPSKILEAEINDRLVNYVFEDNQLITDKQWAYRRGHSTELLLVHLTEIWRTALDSDSVVAAAFVDFRKAFDSVSHEIWNQRRSTRTIWEAEFNFLC